ncbi:hypothetical protein [Bradyrhizobium sp. CCBAU 53351]|uniref:hypothetical protein n=1 Tax=Bradyrhizobium sp. CCBAU 53351 TaxID=1325114 RepID=UPI0018888A2C|nr:hypothetical protein [Bradyrhizobium sp. CCBAU 53351]
MINVGKPGSGALPGNGLMTPNNVGVDPRTGPQADLTDGGCLDFDEDATGSSYAMTDREAGFLRSFRAALRESKRDSQGQDGQEQQMPEPRVVAVAEQPRWTGLPTPADAAPASAGTSSTDAIVNAVTEAIDRSIRAEMAPRDGTPLQLAIAFPHEGLGLTGLYITVTPTTLDVTFERVGPELSEALVRAAEALAARLLTRQSKKIVRILDIEKRPESADREPEASSPPLSLFL